MPKIKSFCDPPSPSKFKPSDDVPDIEEEILLESDSDIGGIVHPLDEENNICDGTFMGETVNTNLLASDATDIANTEVRDQGKCKKKATMKLRKKKEDDVVSDNRFKLHNGREKSQQRWEPLRRSYGAVFDFAYPPSGEILLRSYGNLANWKLEQLMTPKFKLVATSSARG
ncbi:hypothetical protein JHK82_055687 [Glycine max]|nr:hypothetical protein JHK82_055687 [Glycine max]